MAAPNIVNVSSILGKTAAQIVTNSANTIVTNSVSSNKVLKVNALYVSNIDPSGTFSITLDFFRNSVAYRITPAITIPIAATLDIISKPIYLEEGDSLRVTGSTTAKLEAVCSYEEIT
jgi:hypothetical protein